MTDRKTVYGYPVAHVIKILESHGYIVRHESEAPVKLSWNRTHPFPKGVNFEHEALRKIKEQLTVDHLVFRSYPTHAADPLPQTMTSGTLQILR